MPYVQGSTYQLLAKFDKFKGIDNVTDPISIAPGYSSSAFNVDIDDEGKVIRRQGYALETSGSFHSVWSDQGLCFAVRNNNLIKIEEDGSYTTVISSVHPDAPFAYVYQNGRVYFSNGIVIGYIDGTTVTYFSDPDLSYMQKMPAGEILEFHNARLLVVRDDMVFISEAGAPGYFDTRTGWRKVDGRITMLKSTLSGVYLSHGDNTYFAAGDDFLTSTRVKVAESGALVGSAIRIDGEEISGVGIGRVIMWASSEGVYLGLPKGELRNITWSHYNMLPSNVGSAVYHSLNGYTQYLLISELPPDAVVAEGEMTIPVPSLESIG